MKTLGLIGGMSWESTALYYRLINEAAKARLGRLHSAQLLLWSFDFAPIAQRQQSGDWSALELVMNDAARRLVSAGADAIVICSNTMHKLHGEVQSAVDVPVLHIVDVTAVAMKQKGCARPILLGTRYTMEQPFYLGRLAKAHGIQAIVPDEAGKTAVNRIIYDELCRGIIKPESKAVYLAEIGKLLPQGADSIILGCTEVGMLVSQQDVGIPAFDTTEIHAHAALDFALCDDDKLFLLQE
jgi:aspartate racemase